ncbi:MAG: hypothetical protein K8U03_03895 [Planctomycetia bacterium]|nr:hypothetical protein [Planctomycetia bacterium]
MPVGQLRFIVPDMSRISDRSAQQAYLTGFEPIPNYCRTRLSEGELTVEREGFDSVKLNIPWRVDGFGEILIGSATLMQRERPYLLPLELARGKINQVRNQFAEWQLAGLAQTPALKEKLSSAVRLFTEAAVRQHEPDTAAKYAQEALVEAFEAALIVADLYSEQALVFRHQTMAKLPIAFGTSLGRGVAESPVSLPTASLCNTAVVPLIWRNTSPAEDEYLWDSYNQQIQWCRSQGMNIAAGPLLRLDERGFPDWLTAWQGDVDAITAFSAEYVAKTVQQFRGRVSFWNCATFSYRAQSLGLKDEDKLRIIARAIDTVRRFDADTPLIVSFDQPWGEYLRKLPLAYPPIHIADHLVRSGLPIAALGLELEVGYHPDGSYLRDPLELGKLIDAWSMLGMPLYVFLTVPSGESPDPLAEGRSSPIAGAYAGGWSPAAQADWVRKCVPILLAKPSVQGIAWQQLRDDEPHDLPHGGLFDFEGMPKPALTALAYLRKQHLI